MKYLLYPLLLLIVAFFTLSLRHHDVTTEKITPDYWTDRIRYDIVQKYEKKYNLEVSGIIDGMPNFVIETLGAFFNRYQVTSKAKARQIIVDIVSEYVDRVNNCPEVQPHLRDRPFTVKNIEIFLILFQPNGKKIFHPDLRGVFTCNGKIMYKSVTSDNPYQEIIEKETFEEALELVKTDTPPEDLS